VHESYPALPYEAALSLIPPPILSRLVTLLAHVMRRRHPRLVAAFARLEPAVVHVAPTGARHRFAIAFDAGGVDIRLLPAADRSQADATIHGKLAALIDLLEGRIDGDAMFFTRHIEITGATDVVVAVRNTLDREEIVMRDEIAALFGPLGRPARRMARRFEAVIGGTRTQVAAMHASLHAADAPPRDIGAECDALRAEVAALQTRLAKFDVRQLRADAAAGGTP